MADDIVMALKGIDGESKLKGHLKEIDLISADFGVTAKYYDGQAAGRASFSDVHFVKFPDRSSPNLMQACSQHRNFSEAKIVFRKQGGKQLDYLVITLKNLSISSWNFGYAGSPESFSVNYDKITYDYTEQNEKGDAGGTVSTTCVLKEKPTGALG